MLNNLALEKLSDLIRPAVSEISKNYLRKSKYKSTSKIRPARAPFLSDETICEICIRYTTIETKEAPVWHITGFFFRMNTQVKAEVRS